MIVYIIVIILFFTSAGKKGGSFAPLDPPLDLPLSDTHKAVLGCCTVIAHIHVHVVTAVGRKTSTCTSLVYYSVISSMYNFLNYSKNFTTDMGTYND